MLRDLVLANRSYRRFNEKRLIDESVLRELVDLARLTPSAQNLQSLKYAIVNTPEQNALVFPTLAWAGYLVDWPGPAVGERPSAYIIILGDRSLAPSFWLDHGIAAQTILLGAVEKGLGGCMIGAVNRDQLRAALRIPEHLEVLLVVALGEPTEKVVVEEIGPDGNVRYYRDAEMVHHVPKRSLDDIIIDL
jgi:nitroreductase